MNKNIATDLFHKIRFVEDGSDCWIPETSTRSLRHDDEMVSLVYLSYILSGNTKPYETKQEAVRACGNSNCFNPDHIIFDEITRFWFYVDTGNENECWEWERSKDGGGYGVFTTHKYGREKSHRISYLECVGEIPEGLMVLHTCDNPSCCNPKHLFLGTNQENMDDKVKKNRQSRLFGGDNGRCQMSEKNIMSMRKDYRSGNFSYSDLVYKYKISQTQVARIIKRESWAWVNG